MKLRLLILLAAAAALAAAPAAGQTVKSLGYNTTNGQIVYSGSNSLTFTNALQFATNARATTRTNLGLGGSDSVTFSNLSLNASGSLAIGGMNVTAITSGIDLAFKRAGSTELELKTNGLILHAGSYAFSGGNSNGASTSRTNLGLGGTNTVTFSNIQLNSFPGGGSTGFVGHSAGQLTLYGTNVSTSVPAFYGYDGFNNTAFSAATARTNLALGATNNVTFSNVTASGTLTATGNATLNGTDNLAPSQTTNSASSLMTRSLSDARYLPNFSQFLNGRFYYQTAADWMPTKATNGGTASFVATGSRWAVNLATNASSASGVRLGRLDRGYNDTPILAWSGAFTAFVYAEIWSRTNAICRFVVTQTGTTEGIANYPTNRAVGIEFRGDANMEARLIAHNGTTATNGPWVSFDYGSIVYAYNTLFAVRHLTNGTVELYRNSTNVPSATITGGPTNGSSAGFVHVDYGMENSTNAAVNAGNMQNSVQWWGVEYD